MAGIEAALAYLVGTLGRVVAPIDIDGDQAPGRVARQRKGRYRTIMRHRLKDSLWKGEQLGYRWQDQKAPTSVACDRPCESPASAAASRVSGERGESPKATRDR